MPPCIRLSPLFALLLINTSDAAEKIIPFSEMSWLAEIPPSELFAVTPMLSLLNNQQTLCKGASLAFINKDKVFPVEIDANGQAALTIPAQYFSQQTKIRLQKDDDAGPCSMSIGITFTAKSPSKPLRYKDYMSLEATFDQVVDSQAGMLSMFAPDFEGLQFIFADQAAPSLTLVNDDGSTIELTGEQQRIKLPKNSTWLKRNPVVHFSETPLRIGILLED